MSPGSHFRDRGDKSLHASIQLLIGPGSESTHLSEITAPLPAIWFWRETLGFSSSCEGGLERCIARRAASPFAWRRVLIVEEALEGDVLRGHSSFPVP